MVELLVGGLKGFLFGGKALDTLRGGKGSGRALGGEGIVNIADQEDHLEPAQSGNGFNGSKTVGDGIEGDARGDLAGETNNLRDDVT